MQQHRRGVHPGAGPNRACDPVAHHALVETRVARVNFHEQIGDTMDLAGEQKGDIEDVGHHILCAQFGIEREAGHLADPSAAGTHTVDLVPIQRVGQQAGARVDAQRQRTEHPVPGARGQRDLLGPRNGADGRVSLKPSRTIQVADETTDLRL